MSRFVLLLPLVLVALVSVEGRPSDEVVGEVAGEIINSPSEEDILLDARKDVKKGNKKTGIKNLSTTTTTTTTTPAPPTPEQVAAAQEALVKQAIEKAKSQLENTKDKMGQFFELIATGLADSGKNREAARINQLAQRELKKAKNLADEVCQGMEASAKSLQRAINGKAPVPLPGPQEQTGNEETEATGDEENEAIADRSKNRKNKKNGSKKGGNNKNGKKNKKNPNRKNKKRGQVYEW